LQSLTPGGRLYWISEVKKSLLSSAAHTMKNKKQRIIERMLRARINRISGEEDFWLISILKDDPDLPTWEEGFCVTGKYEKVIGLAASIIAGMEAAPGTATGVRYDAYQGEDARRFRAESVRREIRYQQERAGQPHN
jgi:hypothetical protein